MPQHETHQGKSWKNLYVHHTIEIGSVIVPSCFCFSNILKYILFPNFPLVDSVIGGFYWLFLWNFKEKSINRFYDTA